MEKFGWFHHSCFCRVCRPYYPLVDGRVITPNIPYGHHIYGEGYRYRGRPIGHWADQDSQILSIGGFLQRNDGIGWGFTGRNGDLNAGPLVPTSA